MPYRETIDVVKGDHWEINNTLTQTVDGVTTIFNPTGSTLLTTILLPTPWSGAPTVINAAAGKIQTVVPNTITANAPADIYTAEVKITTPSGLVKRPEIFNVRVRAGAT